MGKITGFMEYQRLEEAAEAPQSRMKHWREFVVHLNEYLAVVGIYGVSDIDHSLLSGVGSGALNQQVQHLVP